jgi:hypothetical protein
MTERQSLKQQCEALGIHVLGAPFGVGVTYLGVFPPARRWHTEDEACAAALAHYRAIQPEAKP